MSNMKDALMRWQDFEIRVRNALRMYKDGVLTAEECLLKVDDALGEETGRGFVLQ